MHATDTHLKEGLIGGASAESIAGIAAIVLTVVGLANILPHALLSVAAIAVGAGLLVQGSAVAAEHKQLVALLAEDTMEEVNLDTGISVELAGGLAAIVMGILSLLMVAPAVLMPATAVVVGGTLLFSSGTTQRMNAVRLQHARESQDRNLVAKVTRELVNTSAAAQGFIGLGAVVLGILGLISIAPFELALVALLASGASMALSGSAIGSRLYGALTH
jgi:hypothetical protein